MAKGKDLVEAQAPLHGLRAQRSTLETEKRDKHGESVSLLLIVVSQSYLLNNIGLSV